MMKVTLRRVHRIFPECRIACLGCRLNPYKVSYCGAIEFAYLGIIVERLGAGHKQALSLFRECTNYACKQ